MSSPTIGRTPGEGQPAAADRGWTLVEVLVALCLVGAAGALASAAGACLARHVAAAHAEAAGLAAASAKLEELIASDPAIRASGNDALRMADVDIVRTWRVRTDEPARGVDRLEVTARWDHPSLTLLTLAAVWP